MNTQKRQPAPTTKPQSQSFVDRIVTAIVGFGFVLTTIFFLVIAISEIANDHQLANKSADLQQVNDRLIATIEQLTATNERLVQAGEQLNAENKRLTTENEALTAKNADLVAALHAATTPDSLLEPVLLQKPTSQAITELDYEATYYLSTQLPSRFLRHITSPSNPSRSQLTRNNISATVFYPETISAGTTGKFIILLNVNGYSELLTGHAFFTATDDLHLINGSRTPVYESSGGDLDLTDEGTLIVRFYTGATDEFKHSTSGYISSSAGQISCDYIAY